MKLRISSILLFVLTTPAFANHTSLGPVHGKAYVGIFGGGGSSSNFNASQFGTAYFAEINGGPLAVNAFGHVNRHSAAFFGAQLGYQVQEIFANSSAEWRLGSAAELEGYTTNKSSFSGNLNNNTVRLQEHDFLVSYPMRRTVFLANAILNFNSSRFLIHPYIGFGIGNAVIRISGAKAMQINPTEAGVNHYNSDTSDTTSTFAGQIKLGLGYDINKYFSIFAEYRWLYLASTQFTFGSTVYADHVETSSWQVKMNAQKYNLGTIGLRFSL